MCQAHRVVQIVHYELVYATFQGRLVTYWQRLFFRKQVVNDVLRVVESLQEVLVVVTVHDAVFALAVEIALVLGAEQALTTQYKLWGELFVFVQYAWREAQVAEHRALEDVATCRRAQVVVAHIFGARHWGGEHEWGLVFVLVCEMEQHNVGVVVACEVEGVLIG